MNNIKIVALLIFVAGCSSESQQIQFESLLDSEWLKIVNDNPVYDPVKYFLKLPLMRESIVIISVNKTTFGEIIRANFLKYLSVLPTMGAKKTFISNYISYLF